MTERKRQQQRDRANKTTTQRERRKFERQRYMERARAAERFACSLTHSLTYTDPFERKLQNKA